MVCHAQHQSVLKIRWSFHSGMFAHRQVRQNSLQWSFLHGFSLLLEHSQQLITKIPHYETQENPRKQRHLSQSQTKVHWHNIFHVTAAAHNSDPRQNTKRRFRVGSGSGQKSILYGKTVFGWHRSSWVKFDQDVRWDGWDRVSCWTSQHRTESQSED